MIQQSIERRWLRRPSSRGSGNERRQRLKRLLARRARDLSWFANLKGTCDSTTWIDRWRANIQPLQP